MRRFVSGMIAVLLSLVFLLPVMAEPSGSSNGMINGKRLVRAPLVSDNTAIEEDGQLEEDTEGRDDLESVFALFLCGLTGEAESVSVLDFSQTCTPGDFSAAPVSLRAPPLS